MNYSDEEKEVIDKIETLCKYLDVWKENYTIVPEDKRYFKTLLNLIQKQDKIIDKMAEQLAGLTIWNDNIEEALILGDKEDVKEYFKKECESDEI